MPERWFDCTDREQTGASPHARALGSKQLQAQLGQLGRAQGGRQAQQQRVVDVQQHQLLRTAGDLEVAAVGLQRSAQA